MRVFAFFVSFFDLKSIDSIREENYFYQKLKKIDRKSNTLFQNYPIKNFYSNKAIIDKESKAQ